MTETELAQLLNALAEAIEELWSAYNYGPDSRLDRAFREALRLQGEAYDMVGDNEVEGRRE